MKCLLCGNEFEENEEGCQHSCPLSSNCGIICCPNCGYEWVEKSATVDFFKKIFKKKGKHAVGEM